MAGAGRPPARAGLRDGRRGRAGRRSRRADRGAAGDATAPSPPVIVPASPSPPSGRYVARMRIGLNGGGATVERMIEQAQQAEADGFSALWYPSAVAGDPVAPMAVVGRATTSIELGTSVLQTYTAHPVLQANRALSAALAMGRPGFTLGVGPSHAPVIEGMFGMSYATPGRHTEEYVEIVAALLRGEPVSYSGEELTL